MYAKFFLVTLVLGGAAIAADDHASPYLQQRRSADLAEELPDLPSSRPDRADVFLDLQRHASVGQGDEGRRRVAQDAAVVCRSPGRPLLE